jgi:hypothetical protein
MSNINYLSLIASAKKRQEAALLVVSHPLESNSSLAISSSQVPMSEPVRSDSSLAISSSQISKPLHVRGDSGVRVTVQKGDFGHIGVEVLDNTQSCSIEYRRERDATSPSTLMHIQSSRQRYEESVSSETSKPREISKVEPDTRYDTLAWIQQVNAEF